jgi:hypothetical protein
MQNGYSDKHEDLAVPAAHFSERACVCALSRAGSAAFSEFDGLIICPIRYPWTLPFLTA